MPESDEKPKKRPRSISRWGTGTLSVLQILLLAIFLGAINYLSLHHFWRADLSRGNDYSLSPATKNYLASDAIRKRETPVKWIMGLPPQLAVLRTRPRPLGRIRPPLQWKHRTRVRRPHAQPQPHAGSHRQL